MKSTAKKGDPQNASRGAAVRRAKAELGDAIDRLLNLQIEEMELSLLGKTIGVEPDDVRERLNDATLGELLEWKRTLEDRANVAGDGPQNTFGDTARAEGTWDWESPAIVEQVSEAREAARLGEELAAIHGHTVAAPEPPVVAASMPPRRERPVAERPVAACA
jgi:hypothetical protein